MIMISSLLATLPVSALVAQAESADPVGSALQSFGPIIAIVAIFYFLLLRPQQKEAKEHQNLLASLQKGDQVVTSAGMHGSVSEVQGELLVLEVAPQVLITVDRASVKRRANAAGQG
jgi:preprotein translocase subunit YajC